jgi:hypothetical protein
MTDNDEKVLPVLRLLLIAFFGLLLLLSVQLFLLVTRAHVKARIQGVGQHRVVSNSLIPAENLTLLRTRDGRLFEVWQTFHGKLQEI